MSALSIRRVGGAFGYYGVLVVLSILALVPTLWVMTSSFKTGGQIFSGGLIPDPFTLQGYKDAFSDVDLGGYLTTTLLYAVGGSLGALVTGLLAAYPMARYDFPSRGVLVASFSLALAIPVLGLATPEYFIMRELALYDTKLGFVIFYSGMFFPLSFVILRAFLVSLPPELEEAAIVDGAGYSTIIRKIVLPLARPALATVLVVVFTGIWNEFYFANLLSASTETQNAQVGLAAFRSQFGFNVSAMLAGATVVMLVPIIAFLALQRQVIAGLTAGATK